MGVEPMTCRLGGGRSILLSYSPSFAGIIATPMIFACDPYQSLKLCPTLA